MLFKFIRHFDAWVVGSTGVNLCRNIIDFNWYLFLFGALNTENNVNFSVDCLAKRVLVECHSIAYKFWTSDFH